MVKPGKHLVEPVGAGAAGFHLFHSPADFRFPIGLNLGGKVLTIIR